MPDCLLKQVAARLFAPFAVYIASMLMKLPCSAALILIDAAVADYQHLVTAVLPEADVVVLDPTQDGVVQISQVLASRRGVDSLHILCHGAPGQLQLGSAQLSLGTLGRYAAMIQHWATALTTEAQILLYGCQVAASETGKQLVRYLQRLTGTALAAATQPIGRGCWQLEFAAASSQTVAVPLPMRAEALATYPHTLAVLLRETFTEADVTTTPWIFGTGSAGSANPFLTARATTDPSANGLPGSSTGVALDPSGSGVLRLTNANFDQDAFVIYNSPIASNAGLSITFDFFAYGGTTRNATAPAGADGISFFLIDGAASPTRPGAFGGSLGYAQKLADGIAGIEGGYIGIGLDEFGNFSNPTDVGPTGPQQRVGGPGRIPDSVSVRGSSGTNYAYLGGSGTLSPGIDNVGATNRNDAARRARLDITPAGLLTVRVDLNNDGDFLDPGEVALENFDAVVNNGPIPASFKFGFASSTGDSTNIHEVRNVSITTFTTPPTTADASATVAPNSIVNLTGLGGTDAETSVASFTILTLPDPSQGTLFLGNPLAGGAPVTVGQSLDPLQITQLFFQAAPGYTGGSFTYRAVDSDGDFSQVPGTVTLNLGAGSPPSVSDTTIEVTPGSLTNIPPLPAVDPDGDPIVSYTIVTLPPADQGTLFLGDPTAGGVPVAPGQALTPDQANQLVFQPSPNFTGGTFTFTATDSTGAVDATPATATLSRITNLPPVLPDNSTTLVVPGSVVNLTGLEGTDPDGTITGYEITAVPPPNQGTVFLGNPAQGGTPVTVGQSLTPEQINQLFFRPGAGFRTTSFSYAAVDNRGALSNPRTLTFSVTGTGVTPVLPVGPDGIPTAISPDIPSTPGCGPGVNRRGTSGNNRLVGTPGNDRLRGLNGNDRIRGRQCDDRLEGGNGNDRLFGNNDNDRLFGNAGRDRLDGGRGIDLLNGGLGNDIARGRQGSDRLFGRRGNDRLNGGAGNDGIDGGRGRDQIIGGGNNDVILGRQGNDRIDGGKGDDAINAGLQADRVKGRSGNDIIDGKRGNDRLHGGAQDDQIFGRRGRDRLIGGGGRDILQGGNDPDRFIYRNVNHGGDTILDFKRVDRIELRRIFERGNYSRSPRFENYVRLQQVGADTIVRLDTNGDARGGFRDFITLLNVDASRFGARNFIV